ncbi:hypothetical protein AWN90_04025 [Nocardia terpenica]|uniref:Uncharacterized protein n=1 Tax=Nocardia terpenica TaxID=455432 RepID=A0A164JJ53_9NOCA|nr:hypothetical protein AWN90_04025 [Nocardia terpenica]
MLAVLIGALSWLWKCRAVTGIRSGILASVVVVDAAADNGAHGQARNVDRYVDNLGDQIGEKRCRDGVGKPGRDAAY